MFQSAETLFAQWAALWSRHDIETLLALFTDDCVYEDVPFGVISYGKTELRTFAENMLAGIPDLRMELKSTFVAGKLGAIEWVSSGTHDGNLPGMPATHKKYTIRGVTIAELEGGKIKRNSDYWDLAGFLKQLGLTLAQPDEL